MTSYVMCNKKKLGIKKSDIECLKKSVEDRKLEYFKSELLKILDKKEKEESGEEVSKAFIVQELYKSMTDPLYMAKGGKVGVVGEVRTWNGKKYKKMPNKKWVRIYDTHDKHTEISIARLKGKVRNAQSVDELFEIVMNNTHRFSDENGKPLDIVLELKKEVDAKKKALNAGKPSTKEQIKKEQKKKNQKVELTEKQKENLEKINDILNKNVETFPVGEFSEENFKKLFENGIDSPIEHIKIGENQYQKLIEKNRQDLAAMADVMKNPALIMKTDSGAKVYAKTYERKNHKKTVISVIVDKGKLHISISTHIEKNKQLAKKMDSILFDRTESVHGDNTSQEKTPDNSNITQDYTVVNKKDKTLNPGKFGTTQEMLDKYNVKLIDFVDNWAVFEQNGEYGYIHNGKAVRQWHKTADEVKEIIKQKADEEKKKIEESERIEKDAIKQLGEEKYKSLFDYAAKYYDNLAKKTGNTYGNARIKEVILNAIDKINKKDWEFEELVRRSDNKVSRKVFETLTGIDLGTNEKAGTAAWEKWCGKENVEARRKQQQELKDAEKAKEEAEKKAALEAEHKEYNGFLDGKTAAYKGKAKQILDKKYRYDGKVMSFQELADKYIKNGGHVFSNQNYSKTKTYYYVNDSQGRGYEVPKIVYDYAKHIQENGILEKSFSSIVNELKKSYFDNIGA